MCGGEEGGGGHLGTEWMYRDVGPQNGPSDMAFSLGVGGGGGGGELAIYTQGSRSLDFYQNS